jgi:hypothetical protein
MKLTSPPPKKIKMVHFWVLPRLKPTVLLCRFFFGISYRFGPNSGFWCCVFLTIRNTLLSSPFFLFGIDINR